jgi:uncharacterized glyoxalase superfamily protein PhnB
MQRFTPMLAYADAPAAIEFLAAEPADPEYGERSYRAIDPEGQRWIFGAPLRQEAP